MDDEAKTEFKQTNSFYLEYVNENFKRYFEMYKECLEKIPSDNFTEKTVK